MDTNILKPKISIIGAGNVGIRYAYSVMIQGLARSLVLVDINRHRLEGEVMDLAFGEPFVNPIDIQAGDYPDIKGSDIVVVTAGMGQKPGQTRLDLVKDNINLLKKIIPKIIKYSPDSIILMVTNPVDILSYFAWKISGKSPAQVIGSGTVLDTGRFRHLLAKKFGVDPRNVHAYILGEHGDSEVPIWSRATVGGIPMADFCGMTDKGCGLECPSGCDNIFQDVKNAAYNIIKRKGETSYAIGLAGARITKAILGDENSILPVSVLVEGYKGIEDVYLSLPAIVNRRGVERVLSLDISPQEEEKLINSAHTLRRVITDTGF